MIVERHFERDSGGGGLALRMCIWLAAMAVTAAIAEADHAEAQDLASRKGEVCRIDDPLSGHMRYFRVYVPKDYSPDRDWPIVLFYHGLGGLPDAESISSVVEGQHYIVVGMGYYMEGMEGYQYLATEDVRIIRHVLERLGESLRIDRKKIFVAGFSKGGFYTVALLNKHPEMFAGGIILGAGLREEPEKAPDMSGKDIFIGCGVNDPFFENALSARKYFYLAGASVTFDGWPRTGHSVGSTSEMREWLLTRIKSRSQAATGPSHSKNAGSQTLDDGHRLEWAKWTWPLIAAGVGGTGFWQWQRRRRNRSGASLG